MSKKREDKDAEAELAVREVRGGSICDPNGPAQAHLIRGTTHVAVCRQTTGPDTRPRWRAAGR